jgi:AmmeMemoRadiSam system protein B/AmmeMemoRadiSam system protein A
LEGNRCRYCGTTIAGHFDQRPGNWGGKRLPVRISAYAAPKTLETEDNATMATSPPDPQAKPAPPARPQLTRDDEDLVLRVAARRVVAAVKNQPAERLEDALGELGRQPVLGAFVSLKRGGQLRSCCGFLGQSVPLREALEHAAVRAAKDDPRFPPISPTELDYLDIEVWLLWGMEPVAAKGADRANAITIGKHGLQIARGANRGLLLPGVATEHKMNAEEFLRAVCRKAGLPPEAWKDDDTVLMTFEGYAIRGQLGALVAGAGEAACTAGPSTADVTRLADFCRQNIVALVGGATPNYYLPGEFDGSVSGVALTVSLPSRGEAITSSQIALHPDLPLQSSLFELTKAVAAALQAARVNRRGLEAIRVGVSVFWDPAMHGLLAEPELQGIDPKRRALMVVEQGRWALVFDPDLTPAELVARAAENVRLADRSRGSVYSMEFVSTEPRLATSNVPKPVSGPAVRPPAVAGRFYPGDPLSMEQALDEMLPAQRRPEPWAGALVPHAGWVYSGKLAAAVFSRIRIPQRVIIVCPKHSRSGANWAVAPNEAWSIPGGCVEADPELARRLAGAVDGLELDAAAHAAEHAIEVQLPILHRLAPKARVVGIAIHGGGLEELQRFADQLAAVLGELAEEPLLVISSDMNHYADDATTRRLDRAALDCLERLDPEALYRTVMEKRISMCGVLPAVLVLKTLRRLGSLNRQETVGYATSADASGDKTHVVGYAGMLFA